MSYRLSIVMPVFNEEATVGDVVKRVLALTEVTELVIVDDCSTDGTNKIARTLAEAESRIKLVRHAFNRGKTDAVRTGFALTTGDIVMVQDADLEYDPSEISRVIKPIVDGHADVVYGSRTLARRSWKDLYFGHYLANKALTFLTNLLARLDMTDVETGCKAFRGDIIRNMKIASSGFGFDIEVTAKVAKLGVIVREVPVSYYGRTYAEGKKIGLMDGIAAFWYVIRFNLLCSLKNSFGVLPQTVQRESCKVTAT